MQNKYPIHLYKINIYIKGFNIPKTQSEENRQYNAKRGQKVHKEKKTTQNIEKRLSNTNLTKNRCELRAYSYKVDSIHIYAM